jgi:hypothetical protein
MLALLGQFRLAFKFCDGAVRTTLKKNIAGGIIQEIF